MKPVPATGRAAAAAAALLLLILLAGPCAASGPAGTVRGTEPEINLLPVAAGYFHRTVRMEPREGNFRPVTFRQEQVFVETAAEKYGWSAFFRAGGATLSDEDDAGEARFDAGYRPFFAGGFRYMVPVNEDGATMVVGTARVSYTLRYEAEEARVPPDPVLSSAKVRDFWGGDATLALQRRFGPVSPFAGGAVQYARLKVVRSEAGTVTTESSYDTASNLFGAIAGVRIDLGPVSIQAEAQQFRTLSFGGTLSYAF